MTRDAARRAPMTPRAAPTSEAMAAAETGVRGGAPARARGPGARRPRRGAARAGDAGLEGDAGSVLRRVREAEKDLLVSDFWSSALETFGKCLRKPLEQLEAPLGNLSEALGELHLDLEAHGESETPASQAAAGCRLKCVCYGLGSFATCVAARSQLAFLLLLLQTYQIPRHHCWVYDPLFSQREVEVLHALGLMVLQENEEGKRSVCGEPTVFYMPHCGTALYNNVLWSNWSVDALSRMLIIGNSFRGLRERLLTRILLKNYPYVARVLDGLEELALPQTLQYANAFNDTSAHWFPVPKLSRLPGQIWTCREEPDYQDCEDLEIIRKEERARGTRQLPRA